MCLFHYFKFLPFSGVSEMSEGKEGMSTCGHKLASKDCKWWVLFVVLALEEDSERLRSSLCLMSLR